MSAEKNKIIFGPINSRRFGVSLGIDLSPSFKQCNFDCLYCELAPSATTNTQHDVVSVENIMQELQKHLHQNIDVITLTANGEPTLYPYLEELITQIDSIKKDTKTLILTNSATLNDPHVFQTLLKLDEVKLSLDAVSPDVFKKIDRPHNTLDINTIVQSVIDFSQAYKGKLYIEILFVKGINDTQEEIAKLNEVLLKVNAHRIDLGTIDRPPAYPVEALSYTQLHTIAQMFESSLAIHIASRHNTQGTVQESYTQEEILNTLDKRPLTQEDIELLFDTQTQQTLHKMVEQKLITRKSVANLEFFLPTENVGRKRVKKR